MMADSHKKSIFYRNMFIGSAQLLFGSIFAMFSLTCMITDIGSSRLTSFKAVAVSLFFVICITVGLWVFIRGLKRIYLVKDYFTYDAKLSADPQRSIDRLATDLGLTSEKVVKRISKMIAKDYFQKAHIDHSRMCLVFDSDTLEPKQKSSSTQQGNASSD